MLEITDISVRFGAQQVLDRVSLRCDDGRITAVIGPNGAGKTTLFDAISGFTRRQSGEVLCDGMRIPSIPHRLTKFGIARTFQSPRLFDEMSVLENLVVASHDGGAPATFWNAVMRKPNRAFERRSVDRADELLEFLELTAKASTISGSLSGGQRKLVETGRALMTDPRFLMLDEPVAGVAPALVNTIGAQLRRLADSGIGVLLIEHNMEFVMGIADHVFVLAQGRLLAEGSPAEIREHPEVLEAYLGKD